MDDGVQYLSPVEERWGEIAVYPELMIEYAERLRVLIRRVWVEEPPGGHIIGTAICLSCLLEAGRYGDLIELLACARMRWWHWHRFGAEALARQGEWDAAITYADGCRSPQGNDDLWIDRFCEDALIKSGRADEAYHRYGLKAATGPTYLAVYRETVKRYPERDRRQVLLDLIRRGVTAASGSPQRRMPGSLRSPSYVRETTLPSRRLSCAPRETSLPKSRSSRPRSGWSPLCACSAAVAMIPKSRSCRKPSVISSTRHPVSEYGIGRWSRCKRLSTAPVMSAENTCSASWPNAWWIAARSRLRTCLRSGSEPKPS